MKGRRVIVSAALVITLAVVGTIAFAVTRPHSECRVSVTYDQGYSHCNTAIPTSPFAPATSAPRSQAAVSLSAPQHCRTVRLSIIGGGHASGTTIYVVALTNTTHSPCIVSGWPAVTVLDVRGRRIPTAAAHDTSDGKPKVVRLDPGQEPGAFFVASWSNWCGARSSSSSAIDVTIPSLAQTVVMGDEARSEPPRCDEVKRPSWLYVGPFLSHAP